MIDMRGRRTMVVGLGVSGFATARALLGMGASVVAVDDADTPILRERAESLSREGATVRLRPAAHPRDVDLLVVSPGVPPGHPAIASMREAGVRIVSEVELAAGLTDRDVLAVTGTNGKTTTTTYLAQILTEGNVATVAAGNIGLPLIEAIAMVPAGGAIALEVSSFQLANIETFRPRVAVLLNVAEDHTDWHGSFESYLSAKARVTQNQRSEDVFVYNGEDEHATSIARGTAARLVPFSARRPLRGGIGVEHGGVWWKEREIFAVADLSAMGAAALEDAIAAAAAALEYGVEPDAVARAVKGFRPLAHRMEVVAEVDGVRYVDDSKATNPHAAIAAVSGSDNVVLIAGGRSKGIDLSPLLSVAPALAAVVAMGEAADELAGLFGGRVPVERAGSMDEAIALARKFAVPGGSILLSPGCASLDMYDNYAQRGEDFARAVRRAVVDEED